MKVVLELLIHPLAILLSHLLSFYVNQPFRVVFTGSKSEWETISPTCELCLPVGSILPSDTKVSKVNEKMNFAFTFALRQCERTLTWAAAPLAPQWYVRECLSMLPCPSMPLTADSVQASRLASDPSSRKDIHLRVFYFSHR